MLKKVNWLNREGAGADWSVGLGPGGDVRTGRCVEAWSVWCRGFGDKHIELVEELQKFMEDLKLPTEFLAKPDVSTRRTKCQSLLMPLNTTCDETVFPIGIFFHIPLYQDLPTACDPRTLSEVVTQTPNRSVSPKQLPTWLVTLQNVTGMANSTLLQSISCSHAMRLVSDTS